MLGVSKSEESNEMLGRLMHGVARVMGWTAKHLSFNFPGLLADIASKVRKRGTHIEDAFMFPTQEMQTGRPTQGQRRGAETAIPSHAVAIRMEGLVGLHRDQADAPRKRGAPMLYKWRGGIDDLPSSRPLPSSDLLVAERHDGGACLRIQVACRYHLVVVSMDASKHPHANVYPNSGKEPDHAFRLIRIVPYCQKNIDICMDYMESKIPKESEDADLELTDDDWKELLGTFIDPDILEWIHECSGNPSGGGIPTRLPQRSDGRGQKRSGQEAYIREFGQTNRGGRKKKKGRNNYYARRIGTSKTARQASAANKARDDRAKARARRKNEEDRRAREEAEALSAPAIPIAASSDEEDDPNYEPRRGPRGQRLRGGTQLGRG